MRLRGEGGPTAISAWQPVDRIPRHSSGFIRELPDCRAAGKAASPYSIPSNSISKTSTWFGPISGPLPSTP